MAKVTDDEARVANDGFIAWRPDFTISWYRHMKDGKAHGTLRNGKVDLCTFVVSEHSQDYMFLYSMLRVAGVKQEFTLPLTAPGAWRGETD